MRGVVRVRTMDRYWYLSGVVIGVVNLILGGRKVCSVSLVYVPIHMRRVWLDEFVQLAWVSCSMK